MEWRPTPASLPFATSPSARPEGQRWWILWMWVASVG